MIGSIIGDIIGSRFEKKNLKSKEFELFTSKSKFTDDTVLTIAIARSLLHGIDYEKSLKKFALRYPFAGYGNVFKQWMIGLKRRPYQSWANGSAMRVSPIDFVFNTENEVLLEAKKTADVTHNHPEGVKGAQAVALSIFLARHGATKQDISEEIQSRFSYDLSKSLDKIRPNYKFDVSCKGSVPQAITAFLESTNFEDSIRNAISIGGDSDTIACVAGGIAQAYYKEIPTNIRNEAYLRLPKSFIRIIEEFEERFI